MAHWSANGWVAHPPLEVGEAMIVVDGMTFLSGPLSQRSEDPDAPRCGPDTQ
jgi:hypothetical protein